MTFLEELEELARKQEELEQIIFDPTTQSRAEPPYLLCSDSRIYSASSLGEWARTCLSSSSSSAGGLRSMMDQTYLKPRARNVTGEVAAAASSLGIELQLRGLESSFPWISKDEVDIVRDVAGVVHPAPPRTPDVLEWKVNIASKLKSDLASAICMLAGIESAEEIRIECATRREDGGRITLLTPPPDPELKRAFAALAEEMGIGSRGITNPECIGTATLRVVVVEAGTEEEAGEPETLEEMIVRNRRRHAGDRIFEEMWNVIASA